MTTCPTWCRLEETRHRWDPTPQGSPERAHVAASWPEVGGGDTAAVSLFAMETAGLGVGPLTVHLLAGLDAVELSPDEARKVAAHLVQAAGMADELARPVELPCDGWASCPVHGRRP